MSSNSGKVAIFQESPYLKLSFHFGIALNIRYLVFNTACVALRIGMHIDQFIIVTIERMTFHTRNEIMGRSRFELRKEIF